MATYTDIATFRRDFWDVADDEAFERILNRASVMAYNVINRYLTGVYTVPFSITYPPDVVDISDLLTKGIATILQLKQGALQLSADTEGGEIGLANKWLQDIVAGKAHIVGATRLATRGAYHNMEGYMHIFDLDNSMRHEPDIDYMDELTDKREP